MSDTKQKEKEGWYPGKMINKRKASVFKASGSSSTEPIENESPVKTDATVKPVSTTEEKSSTVSKVTPQNAKPEAPKSATKPVVAAPPSKPTVSTNSKPKDGGWYPGKFLGAKPPKESSSKPVSFIRSKLPVAGKPPVKTVGNVIIKVLGVKHMSATRPSFEVWLGTQVETFQFLGLEQDGGSTEEFEGFFSLGDLTSDIVILVKEEYRVDSKRKEEENFVGRVVIPITSYLTMQGRMAPKKEWMAVYPIANHKDPMEMYQSGLHELPASGMPKSKQSLGFLCVQIELLLPEGPVYMQYLEGEPPRPSHRTLASADVVAESGSPSGEEGGHNQVGGDFDPEKFFRICQRLGNIFSPPAALAPVLKFPEVFVLIALYGFLCFGANASNIPLLFFFAVALNGVLSKASYGNVILWNEMLDHKPTAALTDPNTGKALSLPLKRSPEYVYQHLRGPLYDCQVFIERLVNLLEVMSNIWNFSDIRASVVFYGIFGAFTLFATVVLIIFSTRVLFFITGATLLFVNSLRDVFPELFSLEKLYEMLTSEEHEEKFQSVRIVFAKLWLAFSRVPTVKTMVHRHISRSCLVDDGGEEMKDAQIKMKNM